MKSSLAPTDRPFVVLNPRARDPQQSFADGPGTPCAGCHAPVNFHAYAACMRGFFARDISALPDHANVLLLLRRDLHPSLQAIEELVGKQATVFIAWKEAGLHQVSHSLNGKNQWEHFEELCMKSQGALASTPELQAVYQAAGARNVHYVPTPYPVEFAEWNLAMPFSERSGIFLGTREFDVPSRSHDLAVELALAVAREFGAHVTMIDDGSAGRWKKKRLEKLGLRMIRGPLPYPEYLRLISSHRVVFQLDRSAVPGQVAGDCLLARVLCIGGDGAVEREAFPPTCGFGRDATALMESLRRALRESEWLQETEEAAWKLARERLSFASIAQKLENIFLHAASTSRGPDL